MGLERPTIRSENAPASITVEFSFTDSYGQNHGGFEGTLSDLPTIPSAATMIDGYIVTPYATYAIALPVNKAQLVVKDIEQVTQLRDKLEIIKQHYNNALAARSTTGARWAAGDENTEIVLAAAQEKSRLHNERDALEIKILGLESSLTEYKL